jgi:hypothetical protein
VVIDAALLDRDSVPPFRRDRCPDALLGSFSTPRHPVMLPVRSNENHELSFSALRWRARPETWKLSLDDWLDDPVSSSSSEISERRYFDLRGNRYVDQA